MLTLPVAVTPPFNVVLPATPSVPAKLKLLNEGLEVVAMSCGSDSTTAPFGALATTWLAVPVMLVTPLLLKVPALSAKPLPKLIAPLVPPRLVTVLAGAPTTCA